MKVLVSRRPFLPRLDACLALCCCLILLGSRICEARSVADDSGATKVEEAHEGLKSILTQAAHVDEELKSVDEVDVVNEKRLRRVTETLGKSDKEHEDAKVKDVTVSRESAHDRKIRVDETTKEHLTGKKALKNPFRRVKRDDHIANEKIDDTIIKSVEDKEKVESNDDVGQNKRVDVEGIRRLDVDVEEENKKEIHEVSNVNLRSALSEDIEKSAVVEPSIEEKVQSIEVKNAEQSQYEETKEESKEPVIASTDALPNEAAVVENPIDDSVKKIEVAGSIHDQSEGADKTNIPEYATQSSTNYLNSKSKLFSKKQQKISLQDILSAIKLLKRNKRNVDDLLDSYPDVVPKDKKNSVPRRIPPKLTFPNISETELLQILRHISKLKHERVSENIVPGGYFVDSLNDTEKAFITNDQYEILKLIQGLNSETTKASFMSRLVQCIRSLSFIRCVGIFVWPMIASNLPSLPFNLPASRDSRTAAETQIQQLFGVSASDLESELLSRREQIESNFIQLYKTLTEEKFEADVGPLKIKGHGDGELAVTFSGFREGRLSRLKDNKNLPSILTIISEVIEEVFDTRPNKTKNRKDNSKKDKRSRSLHSFEESNFGKHLHDSNEENSKRSVKDDQVINMLLDRMRPSVTDIGNDDIKNYYNIEDAYRAFQVLFGPKITGRISNQLKTIKTENMKNFDELQSVDQLKLVPLEAQINNQAQQLKNRSSKGRALYQFDSNKDELSNEDKTDITKEKIFKLKAYLAEHIKKYLNLNKKKFQSEVTLRLPRLNDIVTSRKMTGNFDLISRGMKSKIRQALPAAGLAVSFLVQIALAHAKAAASVAEILSNMALGSAMLGMVRDMVFGSNNQQRIKYIYDTEKYDAGISWPPMGSDPTISFTPPSIRPI